MTKPAIEVEGLRKTFKTFSLRGIQRVHALRGVDLKVPEGCVFGLLGGNGAGKSTLVKALLAIVKPTAGRGTIFGKSIRSLDARKSVGYMPEHPAFPRYLTGRDMLEHFGRLAGLSGNNLDKDIDRVLDIVAMREWGNTKMHKYSKGMKQRLGVAQAMLGDPKLILLDEPTDGVDPIGRKSIREVIRELGKRGVTVMLNSHLLGEIESMCDEVAIMFRGQVLKQDTVAHITAEVSLHDGKQAYRFQTDEVSDEFIGSLNGAKRMPDGFVCDIEDRANVTEIIDRLRKQNIAIYGVNQQRLHLEDAFMDLIDHESYGVGGQS